MRSCNNSSMLPSLKTFNCPFCHKPFTSKDSARLHTVSRYPLILKCGHTACESCLQHCLKNQQKISCPVCQECIELEGGDISKLLPDVYVLGIVGANLKQTIPAIKMKSASSPVVSNSNKLDEEAFVICDICASKGASFRCDKCEDNFCNTCFDSFHKNRGKSLQKHVGIPVYSNVYSTMVQSGCAEHDGRTIEFFCEEDSELICSLCVVTGNHKGHPVFTLLDKNKACAGDLKKAANDASLVNKRLKFTEQKISQIKPSEKIQCSDTIKKIHEHFHSLHTALTLRENELVERIEALSEIKVLHLEKLRQSVSDSYKDFSSVVKDAELALQNPAVSISAPALIQKLESSQNVPCHLCPISNGEKKEKGISIEFQPGLHDIIRQHGKVDSKINFRYCLMSDNELPEDFVVEPLPSEELVVTDTESVSSDISEDSLNFNNNSSSRTLPLELCLSGSTLEKVNVTYIVNPTCFYVIRTSDIRKLNTMDEKMNHWCQSSVAEKHIPSTLKEGDLYLVRYSGDNKWYRGRVLSWNEVVPSDAKTATASDASVKAESMARVFYVDYGDTEDVPLSKMRNMQTQFLNLPSLAKKCSLYGIVPIDNEWSEAGTRTFRDFVHDKQVSMQVIEEKEGILYVDLSQAASSDITNDVPVSVRDALVFLEFACFIKVNKPNKGRRVRNLAQFYPPEEIRANVRTSVLVSHVESPSRFYVQQLATSRHLSDLILDMKNVYEEKTNILHSVYVPYIGMMCAARYSKDGFWYRAEVIGLPGGAKVEVFYVDFGNREVVHHRYIRKLMDRYAKLSSQAILCCLADVAYPKGSSWTPEAVSWFSNYVSKKHLSLLSLGMIPSNKITKSVLYCAQPETKIEFCINALLVKNAHALATGPYARSISVVKSSSKHLPKKKLCSPVHKVAKKDVTLSKKETSSSSSSLSASSASLCPEELPKPVETLVFKEPQNSVKVLITHAESPGKFFVRIAEEEEKLERLMKALQDVCNDDNALPVTVNIGNSYAVYRESDKKWYRGIILEETNDLYEVKFVDYGFTEKVPIDHLRALPKQHGIDQAFSVECHLADILPAGDSSKWPRAAIDTFKEQISSHDVWYLTGKGHPGENSMPGDLFCKVVVFGGALEPTKVEFHSISEKLLEKGVVLKARKEKSQHPKPQPKSQQETTALHSPSSSCSSARTACSSPCTVIMPSPNRSLEDIETVAPSTMELVLSKPPVVAPRVPVFRWLPAAYPSETTFTCQVTHVADDGCIFLQQKPESTSKVGLMTKTFQFMFKDAACEKLRIPPPVGEAVIARFQVDKKWHRAEIVSDDPNKIKVQFVDFGNFEIIELDDIRTDIVMKEIPRLAIEAELHDTKPADGDSWQPDVLDFIHESIVEEECTCEVKEPPEEGKKLQVTLMLKGAETNISALLKDIGQAISSAEYEQRERERAIKSPVMLKNASLGYKAASRLPLNKPFRICVTQLLEPNVVYLQWLKVEDPSSEEEIVHNAQVEEFLQLMDSMAEIAEAMPPITDPKEGLACCAQYSYDNNWYRCEIESVNADGGVKVCYVDYGNSEPLPLDRLKKPESRFLEFPVQAHLCKLHGLQPVEDSWSKEAAIAMLDKCNSGMEIYGKIIVPGEVNEIDLLTKSEDGTMDLIYKDLIEKGLVKCSTL